MLVLLENHLNYLKDNIFECLFKEYSRSFFFFGNIIMKSFEKENIIKDIRNLCRLTEKN